MLTAVAAPCTEPLPIFTLFEPLEMEVISFQVSIPVHGHLPAPPHAGVPPPLPGTTSLVHPSLPGVLVCQPSFAS